MCAVNNCYFQAVKECVFLGKTLGPICQDHASILLSMRGKSQDEVEQMPWTLGSLVEQQVLAGKWGK